MFVMTMQDYTKLKSSPIERGIGGKILALEGSRFFDEAILQRKSKKSSHLDFGILLIVITAVGIFIIFTTASSTKDSTHPVSVVPIITSSATPIPTPSATPLSVAEQMLREKVERERVQLQVKNAEREVAIRQEADRMALLQKKEADRAAALLQEKKDATVYNLSRLVISNENGVIAFRPGTEFSIISKNSNGTIRIKTASYQLDVMDSQLTHDADLAAELRKN